MNCKTCGTKLVQMFFEHSFLCPNRCEYPKPPTWEAPALVRGDTLELPEMVLHKAAPGDFEVLPAASSDLRYSYPVPVYQVTLGTNTMAGRWSITDVHPIDQEVVAVRVEREPPWAGALGSMIADAKARKLHQAIPPPGVLASGIQEEPITAIQDLAIKNLLHGRNLTLEQVLVELALANQRVVEPLRVAILLERYHKDAHSFGELESLASQLTRLEAIEVIRYLNNPASGRLHRSSRAS